MDVELLHLQTKHPFIIARGGQSDYRTVWVRLTDGDGQEGWGEAARFIGGEKRAQPTQLLPFALSQIEFTPVARY